MRKATLPEVVTCDVFRSALHCPTLFLPCSIYELLIYIGISDTVLRKYTRSILFYDVSSPSPQNTLPPNLTQYEYAPLNHLVQSIRLLRILPKRSAAGLLQCEMIHADVDSTYTCLSYVWGPLDHASWIAVDDRVLQVRRNLLDFLGRALQWRKQ